jgi:tetratricopeptide (TPR) repeat protein
MNEGPLPNVPDSHAVSREAERMLVTRLPGAWTVSSSKEGDDYGVDNTINVASRGHITGRLAHVQIKGTRDVENADRLKFRARTVRYLQSFTNAAMFIRIFVPDEKYWLVPAHDERFVEFLRRPDDGSELSFRLSEHDLVGKEDVAQRIDALSYRQWWLSRHRFGHTVAAQFVGNDGALLRSTALSLRPFVPAWLSLDTIPPRETETLQAILRLSTDGELTVRDSARPTRALELPAVAGARTDSPALLALQLALGFYDIGMRAVAAEIVVRALPAHTGPLCDSSKRLLADAVQVLGDAAFRAIMLGTALQGREWCLRAILEYHFAYHDVPLSPEELLIILEHAGRRAHGHARAVNLFNWANLLHKAGSPEQALILNKRVPQEDRDYRAKPRYWVQRAEILLDVHDFDAADLAYKTAADLGFDAGEVRVRRADGYMMAGNIDKAREALSGELRVDDFGFGALRKVIAFVVAHWSGKSKNISSDYLAETLGSIPLSDHPRASAVALALALMRRTPEDWADAMIVVQAAPDPTELSEAAFTWSASRYGGAVLERLRARLPNKHEELAAFQATLDSMREAARPRTVFNSRM